MRGRIAAGPEYVEHLEGSDKAKERVRVILETMQGQCRVQQACERLGICEQRFRQLRETLLQAAVASVEDRPAGRPRRLQEPAEVAMLRQQVAQLARELQAAQVREEIALALPQVNRTPPEPDPSPAEAPKKNAGATLTSATEEPLPPPVREENSVFRPTLPPLPDAPAVAPSLWQGHLARLLEVLRMQTSAAEAPTRRHGRHANARQCLQQDIRKEAVACYHWLHAQNLTLAQCSQLLHLAARTLRAWDYACRIEAIRPQPVGRPPTRSPLPVRQAIVDYLRLTGPGVGVPTLQQQFPAVTRGELADLLRRYRAVCRARFVAYGRVLHWQTAGRVWAADFSEPSCWGQAGSLPPIAGSYP